MESRGGSRFKLKVTASRSGSSVVQALQNPAMVVAISELDEGRPQLLEITEAANSHKLFFDGAKEALHASVSFRLARESRGRLDTQKLDLGLEIVIHVDAAMVMP